MTEKEKIEQILEPKLGELDCFLVDLKVNPTINRYEVFIDSDRGITIQQCEKVSRYLQFMMDNDTSFPQKYTLDVSSPGMDNPFKVMRQYNNSIGKMVEVLMTSGVKKEGVLLEVTESDLKLAVHHPPKKKGMKPAVTEELIDFKDIKSTTKKITF